MQGSGWPVRWSRRVFLGAFMLDLWDAVTVCFATSVSRADRSAENQALSRDVSAGGAGGRRAEWTEACRPEEGGRSSQHSSLKSRPGRNVPELRGQPSPRCTCSPDTALCSGERQAPLSILVSRLASAFSRQVRCSGRSLPQKQRLSPPRFVSETPVRRTPRRQHLWVGTTPYLAQWSVGARQPCGLCVPTEMTATRDHRPP